jgi:glycosyltransferase involved in cell wall biosynthesis
MKSPLLPEIGVLAQVHDTWGDQWQARHHLVSRLARYFRVVWMNPALGWRESFLRGHFRGQRIAQNVIAECDSGLEIYTPGRWLPTFYRLRWLSKIALRQHVKRARKMLLRQGAKRIVLATWRARFDNGWSDLPFDLRSYHIDDEYSFSPVETPIGADEMRMLREADQVFVTSRSLLQKKGGFNPHTYLVPNGVDYQAFATPRSEPEDLRAIARPRIGYTGVLKEQLDWPLLFSLAQRHPNWSFVFVGPTSKLASSADFNGLKKLANVFFLGSKPTSAVPAYTQNFDVCVMPYRRDDYTKYIYPLKLHEYLASGRPAVGTRIHALEEFERVVRLACTEEEWSTALAAALEPAANSDEARKERQTVAMLHDWDVQAWKIACTLAESVAPELAEHLPILRSNSVARAAPAEIQMSGAKAQRAAAREPAASPALLIDNPSETKQPGITGSRRRAPIGPVLLVSPWYRPAVGGVVEVAERLHRKLNENGVETHLLIAHDGRGGLEEIDAADRVWRLGSASDAFHSTNPKSILATAMRGSAAYWRLQRFVRERGIRAVVALYPIGYSWLFVLLRKLTGVKLVASLHGNDVTRSDSYGVLAHWLLRRTLDTSDAVITCASHLSRKAREICSEKRLEIELIPNCVDTIQFTPRPANFERGDERPTFVHVSNFAAKKRTLDIVEAFADQRIPAEARLIMVGDGPLRERTAGRAKELGVFDRVAFVGAQKDVRPFLWASDVFVLASDDEGAPLAVLEGMACGLPYVSTEWGPAAILPPGECGLVVPAHAPKALAAAMAQIIADPVKCRKMGEQARHRAVNDFREDQYVDRHIRLIERIERPELGTRPIRRSDELLEEQRNNHREVVAAGKNAPR